MEMASEALAYGAEWTSVSCKLTGSSGSANHAKKGSLVLHRRRASFTISSAARGESSSSSEPATSLRMPQSTVFFASTMPQPFPSIQQWNFTDRHLFLLTTIACVTGGAVSALFVAAIPTLLAFKRAAESLEKLLEVTREELPGTMAAVRLSGMEISDLTMELSELGQEISSGVKSSARAVRAAQDGLRHVSTIASTAFLQEPRALKAGSMKPAVVVAARGLRERLREMRTMLQGVATLRHLVGWIAKFWLVRRRRSSESTSISLS